MPKKIFFTTIIAFGLIIVNVQAVTAMGLGDWDYTTKNGTLIVGSGRPWFASKGNGVNYMRQWYFYKDCIIGHNKYGRRSDLEKGNYFIFNEISGKLDTYNSHKKWKESIIKKGLKPKIITRWFSDHTSLIFILFMMSIGFPVVSIPVYYLVYLFLKDVFIEEKFNIKMPFTRVFLFLSFLIFIRILLSSNLQSF